MRLIARATWDGSGPDALAVLGDLFLGTDGDDALVRGQDGGTWHVRPGWTAALWEGEAGVMACTPEAWRVISSLLSDLAAARGEAA